MKNIRNLKHIFIIILISLFVLFGLIALFSRDFTNAINGLFIYRTTGGIWQDYIYKHDLTPSSDIVIINIDDRTLNEIQATGDLKMLTISKQIYADLVEKLE
jgi:CHASE2 domain-containing sensor protein